VAGRCCGVLFTLFATTVSATTPEQPKGHLFIVGGGDVEPQVIRKFVDLAGGPRARVLVLPMASATPEEAGREEVEEIAGQAPATVSFQNVSREDADRESTVAMLHDITGVFFTGGDQVRIMAALQGTRFAQALHDRYRAGAVIAGTSAGAAVMSQIMITGEERRPVPDKPFPAIEADAIEVAPGLGFLQDVIIDQHFVRRRRHNRLLSLVLENPGLLGIGIDEGTGIWVKPDHTFEVLGAGPVVVYDARRARVLKDPGGPGLAGAGLQLHVLRQGARYDLAHARVVRQRQVVR
jgi:cyanophycinase